LDNKVTDIIDARL